MRYGWIAGTCLAALAAAAVFIAGCAAPGKPKLAICPGKADVGQALATLTAHAEQAVSFRASGQILLTYHTPDSNRQRRHNLPMKLWFAPPWETYIQGSIALDPKAVIIGSNRESFWLTMRGDEMSSYYIGQWDQARNVEGLMMSPKVVLEAFGVVVDEPNASGWSLKNQGPFDILTRRDEAGRLVKRVHVYACDYLVRRIEYYDRREKVIAVAELAEYRPVAEKFQIPTRVRVTVVESAKGRDSVDITVNSPRPAEFAEQFRKVYFNPPASDRYENVYTYVDGQWMPQRQ